MPRTFVSAGCCTLALMIATLLASCKSQPMGSSAKYPGNPAMPTTRPGKANNEPPPAAREFRASWVATVNNIDWPSKPGLSTQEQQAEIIRILDRAKDLNLNAIILQVRTTADALYDSKLEPWSYYLTGKQGKAPEPFYDPLKFWIDEAHARGIELHAWFNPYRTKFSKSKIEPAPSHVSVAHPEFAKEYGSMGWMDPGEPAAEDHSFAVFMDVVERYNVDGIHIDDYFYPYPEKMNLDDADDPSIRPFPDDPSYQRYKDAGGKLDRDAWRRSNIDHFIKRIYDGVRARKSHVKFGISPFGVPRPGLPGIEFIRGGFDQYKSLHADTVKWLENGWCDYFVPQCYWKTGSPQPFLALAQWWADHNPKNRNIYTGLFTSKIDWSEESWCVDEILGHVMIARLVDGIHGHVHFSQRAIDQNRKGLAEQLRDTLYARQALTPTSPWLDKKPPAPVTRVKVERVAGVGKPPPPKPKPTTKATQPADAKPKSIAPMTRPAATKPHYPMTTKPVTGQWLSSVKITWQPAPAGEKPFLYVAYYKIGDDWGYKIVPASETEVTIRDDSTKGPATRVSVTAVDRNGNESKRTTIDTGFKPPEKKKPATRLAANAN